MPVDVKELLSREDEADEGALEDESWRASRIVSSGVCIYVAAATGRRGRGDDGDDGDDGDLHMTKLCGLVKPMDRPLRAALTAPLDLAAAGFSELRAMNASAQVKPSSRFG